DPGSAARHAPAAAPNRAVPPCRRSRRGAARRRAGHRRVAGSAAWRSPGFTSGAARSYCAVDWIEEGGMERRKLGELEVSAVGLGCATMTPFYDAPDPASAVATIRRARELGIDFLDTSDAYGAGRNEELIARAVEGHRGEYVIASKFGNLSQSGGSRFSDGRPEYVREACEKSLQRLRTEV